MLTLCFLTLSFILPVDDNAKDALKGFQELIGGWRATGEEPTIVNRGSGSASKTFWKETINWSWKFKGDDAWLAFTMKDGKHIASGELRSLGEDKFKLVITTPKGESQTFTGTLTSNGRKLVAERTDANRTEDARLTLSLVGDIRFQYMLETKPKDRRLYAKAFQVGATREGESLAGAAKSSGPECVVSGGLGTTKVMHKGETYYVCCSGCLEAFKDDPEKYIKEFKAKKK